jgi:hypothetical protein
MLRRSSHGSHAVTTNTFLSRSAEIPHGHDGSFLTSLVVPSVDQGEISQTLGEYRPLDTMVHPTHFQGSRQLMAGHEVASLGTQDGQHTRQQASPRDSSILSSDPSLLSSGVSGVCNTWNAGT